ncbi:Hemolysin, contains CBS domains [Cyclobacterium xiamenense]|uniref:Hemolysin, contains CBS domains n=1 Tax=Cyclobacterium xiamenense TaxID=1297121 RepID=A0A1H6VNJ3_9BACT|nr:hemolysin family protein [Cyclobacterium xiamenense]SEJ06238.1 Hemolysin, contains CBS domains [Cyclobacterium xiamenense]
MFLLFAYLFLAIGVSFVCSALEASLLSITPSYIESLKQAGKTYGTELEKLKSNVDRPLAAILSYNTIAHTVGAAGVGAQATKLFGEAYFGVISAVLTLAILVLSEIFPKSLGATYWKQLAPFIGKMLNFMILSIYPLVKMSEWMTRFFKNEEENKTTREEVAALANMATRDGVFEENESKIIYNLIRFRSIFVYHVMTPRTVTVALEENTSLKDFLLDTSIKKFSRIPIYEERIDQVTGYILKYDVLEKLAQDQFGYVLKDLKRKILVVQTDDPIPEVLEILMQAREHLAMVTDEYGGLAGIVTMEDILETLLGLEIQDETDGVSDMQELARNQWKERALKMGLFPPGENID